MNSLVRPARWKVNIRLTVSQTQTQKGCPSCRRGASFLGWCLLGGIVDYPLRVHRLITLSVHARTGFINLCIKPIQASAKGDGLNVLPLLPQQPVYRFSPYPDQLSDLFLSQIFGQMYALGILIQPLNQQLQPLRRPAHG
ncbi:Uncharacterised protein [Actinobacillus pleuropneumoniae]|nr:Uncharacterised protein [Actinobacillus pleuropneumoniae]